MPLEPNPHHSSDPERDAESAAPQPETPAVGATRQMLYARGREHLGQAFENRAQHQDWNLLDPESFPSLLQRWKAVLRAAVVGSAEEELRLSNSDGFEIRIVGAAEDDQALYILSILESVPDGQPCFITDSDHLSYLAPGACAGTVVAIPKALANLDFPDAESDGFAPLGDDLDEECEPAENSVSGMFFIDRGSLAIEAQRFADMDFDGLVGDLFFGDISDEFALRKEWRVQRAAACYEDTPAHAFVCSSDDGDSFIFEVSYDVLGEVLMMSRSQLMARLEEEHEEREAPAEPQASGWVAIESALASRGYHEVKLLPSEEYPVPELVLANDLNGYWKRWAPPFDWKLRVEGVFTDSDTPSAPLLVQISLRDHEGRYYLPLIPGPDALVHDEAMYAFFEARLVPLDGSLGHYVYSPRMLSVDPAVGLEPLVRSLEKDSIRSPLGIFLTQALSHALKTPFADVASMSMSFHRLVEVGPDQEFLPSFEKPSLTAPSRFEKLLCVHELGSHLLTVSCDRGGIIDLRSDVVARHYFPSLLEV